MPDTSDTRTAPDDWPLRWLPVFYWVLGAVNAIVALYGIVYIRMGAVFAAVPWDEPQYRGESGTSPDLIAWLFVGMGVAFVVGFGLIAALQALTGVWIRTRRRRSMCLVIAGITCVFFPFGTLLGVLTIMTLRQPSVIESFTPDPAPALSSPA